MSWCLVLFLLLLIMGLVTMFLQTSMIGSVILSLQIFISVNGVIALNPSLGGRALRIGYHVCFRL